MMSLSLILSRELHVLPASLLHATSKSSRRSYESDETRRRQDGSNVHAAHHSFSPIFRYSLGASFGSDAEIEVIQ